MTNLLLTGNKIGELRGFARLEGWGDITGLKKKSSKSLIIVLACSEPVSEEVGNRRKVL